MPKTRAPLNRNQILEQALTMLDQTGIEGLSMRKLAASLGIEAMSLYNHVRDKNDILNGAINLALSDIALPNPDLAWQERLEQLLLGMYQTLVAHPALARILASSNGETIEFRAWQLVDSAIAALAESGLDPKQQVNTYRGMLAMCLGFVLVHTQGFSMTSTQAQQNWAGYQQPDWDKTALPHLAQLAAQFKQTEVIEDFRFMLHTYLSALSARSTSQA